MISSGSMQKKNNNKPRRCKTVNNADKENIKIKLSAIDDTKKYYQKYYSNPNLYFISQLKTETINIFLSNYKFNDIVVISRILNKYNYFETINLAPNDPRKKGHKDKYHKNEREPITEGERDIMEKEKRDREIEQMYMLNKITLGIGRHLLFSKKLKNLSINSIEINEKLAKNISKGIIGNDSIVKFDVNDCILSIKSYEILLKGFFNHTKIQKLDLSNNNLGDEYGNMIGRIISRQTFRRDQVIWLYGLRNEKPETNEYTLGLIELNLSGNKFSSHTADFIATSMGLDQYIRSIILSNNNFDKESCKKFIYMLRRNRTLLNIDLRNNPGYDDNIKYRLGMKMSKNIHFLYNQYQKGYYTKEEFDNFKNYIDTSFFNLDYPEEIIKYFNDHVHEISKEDLLYDKKKSKGKKNLSERNKKSNNSKINKNSTFVSYSSAKNRKSKNLQINLSEDKYKSKPKDNMSLKYNLKEKKLMQEKNNINIIGNNLPKKSNLRNTKTTMSGDNNNKLLQENLFLKRKIIEFKAKDIQAKYGKNINLPKKYDNNNLRKGFNAADELLDKLNEVMKKMNADNIYNNINNINNINKNEEDMKQENIEVKKEKFNNIDY